MCDKLSDDKFIMNSWKNRIQNKYNELYTKNNISVNKDIQHSLTSHEVANEDTFLNNSIVSIDKTFKLIDNYPENFNGKVYLAIYSINNTLIRPFLEYLLVKNPPNHSSNPNKLYFPYFDCFQETDIEEESNIILKQIFNKPKYLIEYIGYCITDNSCYLVFDSGSRKYGPKEKSLSSFWWWSTIYEIVETGIIFDFYIDYSVKQLFNYEPGLCRLTTSKGKKIFENPIIAYQFESREEIHKNILFGATRLQIQNKGLFIICSQLNRAKQLALIASEDPLINLNNEPIYKDYQNNYLIMRLAIFKGKSKLISKDQFEDINSNYHNFPCNNINTLLIDYNSSYCKNNHENENKDEDFIFLLKEDNRCYFINYMKVQSDDIPTNNNIGNLFENIKLNNNKINFKEHDENMRYITDNSIDNYGSDSDSDIIFIN
jgi:hypothetical protein